MLLRRVPARRLHFGKRVMSTSQGENGVLIRTSDNCSYEGDILVGADGAYSAVRQSMYQKLHKERKLPSEDNVPLPYKHVALVGQTLPLRREDFPELMRDDSPFECIVGENNYGVRGFENKMFLRTMFSGRSLRKYFASFK